MPLSQPVASTATPGVELLSVMTSTRLWIAIPITQTEPGITKEKTVMSTTPIPVSPDPALQQIVMQAREDLAKRLGIGLDQIDLVELRSVIWPDKSLGCPQPGMEYLQVQQDGLLIRFRVAGRSYEYHSGGNRPPFLCENPPGG
jgi:hypothetical protein